MRNIAIFASGNGSNFEAIATATQAGEIGAKVSLLVCDKPDAHVIFRAKNHQIPVFAFSPAQYADKAAYEAEILDQLRALDIQFIALAGYMRLIGKTLLEAYPHRIVNIHPSLLPAFPGKGAIQQAYESGATETGVSVHYVDAGMDTGPVIAQRKVEIAETDTLQTLEEKLHKIEHNLYIETLKSLFEA
ncbi:MAG: phosphoribosylglycinamide formyltransferase [Oscillospiraceae bacterium]|nr:phosphoribosylglycinamide formyltransferase [Oscillospiraceae bacterium]